MPVRDASRKRCACQSRFRHFRMMYSDRKKRTAESRISEKKLLMYTDRMKEGITREKNCSASSARVMITLVMPGRKKKEVTVEIRELIPK